MSLSKPVKTVSEIVGPGYWDNMHRLARYVRTDDDAKLVIGTIRNMELTFPCENCRKHIAEYLKQFPIEKVAASYDQYGYNLGYFKWTWVFHSVVNQRLKKTNLDYEAALGVYSTVETCNNTCTPDHSGIEIEIVEKKQTVDEIYRSR